MNERILQAARILPEVAGGEKALTIHESTVEIARVAVDVESPDKFQVYADPAGHPFCLCWIQRPEAK